MGASTSAGGVVEATCLLPPSSTPASHSTMSQKDQKLDVGDDEAHLSKGEHPHDHQLENSTEGKHEWKTRPPYRIHESNDKFDVKYVLCFALLGWRMLMKTVRLDTRRTVIASACIISCRAPNRSIRSYAIVRPVKRSTVHLLSSFLLSSSLADSYLLLLLSRALPVGRHLPQRRHQLHARPPRLGMVRPVQQIHRARLAL